MSWIRLFVGRFSGDNHWPHLSDYRGLRRDERVSFALVKTKPSKEEAHPIELVLMTGERLRIPSEEAIVGMVLRVLRSRL
jgi:hypothetical protein